MNREKSFIKILKGIDREGIDDLINYLYEKDFFNMPASTKYHGNYEGGLLDHSINVFNRINNSYPIIEKRDTLAIVSLLHDVCKAGLYRKISVKGIEGYVWNKKHPRGHGSLSVDIIKRFIEITEEEEYAIRYHMGVYSAKEFSDFGEYTLKEYVKATEKYPLVKLLHWSDDYCSTFIEKKI